MCTFSRIRVVKGLRLSFLERKAGPVAVLFIHGNSSCKEVFREQISALNSTSLSVVVPDLPGHGASDDSKSPASTYSFPGYARILSALMRDLGYRSFHIVGWSLGGHIGLEIWSTDPSAISLLISGTPPVRLDAAGISSGFRWTTTTALAGRRRFSKEDMIRYLRGMLGLSPDISRHFAAMVARTDGNARLWMVANAYAGHGVDELRSVSEVEKPLAIIQGRHDPFIRSDYLARIRFRNLWTKAPIILECGHAPHRQVSRTFNRLMSDFLTYVN
jgi:pimeloyl-ACP methyl ester carboxylesterase